MNEMALAIRPERSWLGQALGYLSVLPWIWISAYALKLLSIDGLDSEFGLDGDTARMVIVILPSLLLSFTSLGLSRIILKAWHKPSLYTLVGALTYVLIQTIAMFYIAEEVRACG